MVFTAIAITQSEDSAISFGVYRTGINFGNRCSLDVNAVIASYYGAAVHNEFSIFARARPDMDYRLSIRRPIFCSFNGIVIYNLPDLITVFAVN